MTTFKLKALRHDDLLIPQGVLYQIQWPLTDLAGAPLVHVGWTARSQVRYSDESEAILHEWTTENGGIVLVASSLTLVVQPAVSSAWTWTRGVFDVELLDGLGIPVARLTAGDILVSRERTR